MKTALQQFAESIDDYLTDGQRRQFFKIEEECIQKEKQQIEEAYNAGNCDGNNQWFDQSYYHDTFK